ncbi:murein L,D-transpeptidase [Arachnia propionica]|uniref:Murein L,D-transpeptidase n=2 Tax=Arachnia propionica TaxID=1750 RepID=A0A3P1WN37_9ACTN|nr:murein L,D-transpeptidase [Arachnia propionica]
MCASKADRKLRWMIDGQVVLTLDARFGTAKDPSDNGAFRVSWKSRNHVSTIYHTKMPYAMFYNGGEAVHYSADFAARGWEGGSHGCINIRDKEGIAWLFDQVRVGDKVVVY